MGVIWFFCIPAHGHTNPTIEVVRALTGRGHRVRYYSFEEFREKIEGAGAEFVPCEGYLPPTPEDLDKKAGKDFASLIEMAADTTIGMQARIEQDVQAGRPDCIVSDSVCLWGKLFAWRYGVPFVCSTTTFAFNRYTARRMRQGVGEMVRMVLGMGRINAKMEQLRSRGYPVKDLVSLIQNDNDTDTIVYTSRQFQPEAETFSGRYAFVGPSLAQDEGESEREEKVRPLVYISLGTVLNKQAAFYRECFHALGARELDVVLSAGRGTDLATLGAIPENFTVQPYVDQLAVLRRADVFLTHCGMNSVSESLWYGVPMVLFPQHSEQEAVAGRVEELGAGLRLKRPCSADIRAAVDGVLTGENYRRSAAVIRESLRASGGAKRAAEFIEQVMGKA